MSFEVVLKFREGCENGIEDLDLVPEMVIVEGKGKVIRRWRNEGTKGETGVEERRGYALGGCVERGLRVAEKAAAVESGEARRGGWIGVVDFGGGSEGSREIGDVSRDVVYNTLNEQ